MHVAWALVGCVKVFTRERNPTHAIMASTHEQLRRVVLECNRYVSRLLASGEQTASGRSEKKIVVSPTCIRVGILVKAV